MHRAAISGEILLKSEQKHQRNFRVFRMRHNFWRSARFDPQENHSPFESCYIQQEYLLYV